MTALVNKLGKRPGFLCNDLWKPETEPCLYENDFLACRGGCALKGFSLVLIDWETHRRVRVSWIIQLDFFAVKTHIGIRYFTWKVIYRFPIVWNFSTRWHCWPRQFDTMLLTFCLFDTGLRIRIHFIRIRIQHFRLNTDPDPDPIRILGFNDQKLKKSYS